MASEVQICNRALQKLGAERITSLKEESKNAKACQEAYPRVRDAVLRSHPWSCATKRYVLAADASAYDAEGRKVFQLPPDVVRVLPPKGYATLAEAEWEVEGRKLLAYDSGPLRVRVIHRVTDPNLFDALLSEVIACKLAVELCEEITQSNTKKASLKEDYKDELREAKRANAIEKPSEYPPEDTWVTGRFV